MNNIKVLADLDRIYILSEVCNPNSKIHDNVQENGTGVIGAYSSYESAFAGASFWIKHALEQGYCLELTEDDESGLITLRYQNDVFYLKLDVIKCDSAPQVY